MPDLHHVAWLEAHPERDETWLKRMTADGFDVHHVDGDADNNDCNNLVLIEHRDHFMIHSGARPPLRRGAGRKSGKKKGTAAYGRKLAALQYERDTLANTLNAMKMD